MVAVVGVVGVIPFCCCYSLDLSVHLACSKVTSRFQLVHYHLLRYYHALGAYFHLVAVLPLPVGHLTLSSLLLPVPV